MSFLSGWKMKNPASPPKTEGPVVAAFNPSAAMKPEDNIVHQVAPVDSQMPKFRGLERRLSKDRNIFKRSTDSSPE